MKNHVVEEGHGTESVIGISIGFLTCFFKRF